MSRHPQADLIKEWSEDMSRVVECKKTEEFDWHRARPDWNPDFEYRFKPEPKPDVVRYARAMMTLTGWRIPDGTENLKLTFDGETGKLKAAEVIE